MIFAWVYNPLRVPWQTNLLIKYGRSIDPENVVVEITINEEARTRFKALFTKT